MFNKEVLAKLELKLINLRMGELDKNSYNHLLDIRDWLTNRGISHSQLVWEDTGKLLPSGVMLEPEDAVAFLLKF